MKINWKVRFKNKATLIAMVAVSISYIYTMLGFFDILPSVSEDWLVQGATMLIEWLVGLGILVDPTTKGLGDSQQALEYQQPGGGE